MLKLLPPVFATVTVCAALGVPISCVENVNAGGLNVTIPALTPVPMSGTLCGEPAAESLTSRVAVRTPAAVGVNVTATEQLAPAAKIVPQLLDVW